jgi:hypothetical protein
LVPLAEEAVVLCKGKQDSQRAVLLLLFVVTPCGPDAPTAPVQNVVVISKRMIAARSRARRRTLFKATSLAGKCVMRKSVACKRVQRVLLYKAILMAMACGERRTEKLYVRTVNNPL